MTTIAYDGFTLATDSQISRNDCIDGYKNKIFQVTGGTLACAGNTECWVTAVEWFNKGQPQDAKPTLEKFQAIYIPDDGGPAVEYFETLIPDAVFIPWAGGSGHSWALSAMKLGRDAAEAVQFAIEIDLYSGGEINSVIINTREPQ